MSGWGALDLEELGWIEALFAEGRERFDDRFPAKLVSRCAPIGSAVRAACSD